MDLKVQTPLTLSDNGTAPDGMLLQVRSLRISAEPKNKTGQGGAPLADIAFQVEPGELLVLTGPGRAEKSRLLRTLAGLGPKPGGEVLINGVDLYVYRKLFAPYIGYVPAQPALHSSLTVQEILEYEARLRLPGRVWHDSGRRRVASVLEALRLRPQAGQRFGVLNPFQKYLTSIAVELINLPGLLLLDAPAERLEPAEEMHLCRLLQAIAEQGLTVVQSAATAACAQIADKVLALAGDGSLAWFGPGDAALAYFQGFVPEGSQAKVPLTFDTVFELLAEPCPEGEDTWQRRFQANPAYGTYVDDPLNDKYPDLLTQNRPLARFRGAAKEKTPPKKLPQRSAAGKFSTLVGRSLRVLSRERAGLWILLAPLLAALLDLVISPRQMFDVNQGDPVHAPVALGLVVMMVLLVSALIFHSEISKERAVIGREGRTLSLSVPYALSKVWIVLLAALYQGVVWGAIHFLASGMAGGFASLPWVGVTLALVALAGGIIGLIASSLARSAQVAVLLALIFTLPQLLLSGSVIPIPQLNALERELSTFVPTRYAFESLLSLSGYGADVAKDACWQAPEELRRTFTDEDKKNCICTGDNIFQGKCNFPGIHKFFTFVIEQPPPPEPTPAADITDFAQQMKQYTHDLTTWQQSRSQVTGNAEGLIALAIDQYGQSFLVDKVQHALALLGISLVLIVLLIVVQQRKGYVI